MHPYIFVYKVTRCNMHNLSRVVTMHQFIEILGPAIRVLYRDLSIAIRITYSDQCIAIRDTYHDATSGA